MQFTISRLLQITAVVAVVFAVIGPVLRWLPQREWMGFMLWFTFQVLVASLVVIGCSIARWKLESKSGPRRVVVHKTPSHIGFAGFILVTGCISLIYHWDLFRQGFAATSWRGYLAIILNSLRPVHLLFLGWISSFFVATFWWRVTVEGVEFRENGIVKGLFGYTPYADVGVCRWNANRTKLIIHTKAAPITISSSPEKFAEIDLLLREKSQHVLPHDTPTPT